MGEHTENRQDLTLRQDAFMARVESVLDPAYRLATVMLLDYLAAEDAVHDASVRAWGRYRRVSGEITSFRTWYLAIVASRCRTVQRWRVLRPPRRGPELGGSASLLKVVGALSVATRAALFCHVALDLPMDEVARVLQTSHRRVRGRVYRARERVEAELRREADEEDQE